VIKIAKILALSDIHENLEILENISKILSFDMMVLAGDITELRIVELKGIIEKIDKPIVIINGNHDCVAGLKRLAQKNKNIYFLSGDIKTIETENEELTFLGISGIYAKKKRDIFHFNSRDILRIAKKIIRDNNKADIIISHTPPYHMSDYLPRGGRGGLKQLLILNDICEPKIWITGHTHMLASEKVRGVLSVNCGIGYIGDFAIIDTKRIAVVLGRYFAGTVPAIETALWDFLYNLRKTESYHRLLQEEATLI